MTKYDKIYIPGDVTRDESGAMMAMDEVKNVFVMTIEELREIWEAARKRFWWEECSGSAFRDRPEPDFTQFIENKGIHYE